MKYGQEFEIPRLPSGCQQTRMGWFFGASRQWRGPNGLHIRERKGKLYAHYDREDPRHSVAAHLLVDTPMELAFGVCIGAALVAYLTGRPDTMFIWGVGAGAGSLLTSAFARRKY
jgi:hypothetical protein